jgi:hypothetical protein
MWIMLNDAFFSIVKKDCKADELLVRARRSGDIEKVFGREVKVVRILQADYLYRAVIPFETVASVLTAELRRVVYGNFKDTVKDRPLHDAYLRVWSAMASLQNPRPYSGFDRSRFSQPSFWTGAPPSMSEDLEPDPVPEFPDDEPPLHTEADPDFPAQFPGLPKEVPPTHSRRSALKKTAKKGKRK